MEHSPNVIFSLIGLSEEHPQSVGKVGLLEFSSGILKTLLRKLSISFSLAPLFRCLATFSFLFLKVLPIGALSTSIGSAASSECVLVVSGGLAEGLGCSQSVLRQATSIFGICTQYVRCALIDGRWVLSIDGGLSLSIDGMTSVPIDIDINMVGRMWVSCCELLVSHNLHGIGRCI